MEKNNNIKPLVASISGDAPLRRYVRTLWLCFAIITAGLLFCGCENGKPRVKRVGILCGLDVFATTVDGFRAGMKDLGYVEGTNIIYDIRHTNFDLPAQERILRQFVSDKVDLIVVMPSEVAKAAKEVTEGTGVPVVFCQTNIEGTNVVKSVVEPGWNLTGVRYPGPDLALKRLEILHELAPRAKFIWVPYARHFPIVPDQLALLRPAAAEMGLTLVEAPADRVSDLIQDLEARDKAGEIGIDAVLLISEPMGRTNALFPAMGKFASKHRIPMGGVMYSLEGYSTLFGLATENIAAGKLAAQPAHKVLSGIPPATIPVVSAESFFQLNYKVAQELGLNVPEGLLKQADEVVY